MGRAILFCLTLVFSLWMPSAIAAPLLSESVVDLQLRWHHQFQFAGYYAAVEKGFYKEEGIDVRLHAGGPEHQPVPEVLSGRAQYGEGNSEVLFQRLQGEPLVALAAIFQHSPSILLTLQRSEINSVHNLIGKDVMLADQKSDADFMTMLLNEGISLSQVNIIPSSYQLDDLISGKVDAFNAYSTNEPYLLQQHNIPYNIIDPVTYQIDFYSDILFTTEEELRNHPQRVEAMRRATLKGWRYALDNPEEIIDLLISQYQVNKTREHLQFEATEMRKLIFPGLIEIGHMNPGRWQHMADTFVKAGLVENSDALDGFIYDTSPQRVPNWVLPLLITAFLLLAAAWTIAFYLHRFNRQMARAQATLRESEERFKALSDAAYGGIVIHNKGLILECNNGLPEMTGFSYRELIGMNGLELIAPEHLDTVMNNIQNGYDRSYEVVGVRKDRSTYPLAIKGKNITYKNGPARVIEFLDISERKKAEEKLRLAASVFTHAREGIMITDVEGNIIDVNDTFTHITGYPRSEVLGKNSRFLKSDRHSKEFYAAMWVALQKEKNWVGELWNQRKNGELYAQLVTISAVSDAAGETSNYVALFSDITLMKQHQQQLEHIAHYDALTNLPNRVLLADRLQQAMTQSKRRERSLAVVYLDLDGFKTINDAHGHDMGDEVLIKLSQRMGEVLRDGDTLARIGGDEFVAVLVDLEKMQECESILERLLHAAASPVTAGDVTLQISTSIGATIYPQDGAEADQLMRHADQAMYVAKQMGKNRYHLFDVHHDESVKIQRASIEQIEYAFEHHEFVLYYQPKVNMRTGEVIGAEALIRWQHPERGLVLPGDFLPIIENHPISLEIGAWVIDTALTQIAAWRAIGLTIPVSVNVDALQLQQADFAARLSEALARHPGVEPSWLELEILETSALGDIADVSAIMHSCRKLGVNFALDDFGTGFSSLTYLQRLPVDLLKIDLSFIKEMLEKPADRAIVMGIIGLAIAFHRQVIAEGVETTALGTQLLAMGCELAQGYGIARPMPAAEIPGWKAQWKPDAEWLQ
ncbi:EAL domain-containing protein [uncultured Amphritea sp.]|uniref:EAL domain-containing protein n=1 Tax=uncultured Amphritea sp. TaxID=981605 RepID=UPI002624CB81|nr:EAL domain-containing protein [uncultured Amphritea sp.]